MKIRPIRTEEDYRETLARVDELWDSPLGSPEGDELDVLATLVEAYEQEHYPMLPPDPVEAIKFRMEQMGLSKTDMAKYLGSKSRVSEVLSGRRKLSLNMVKSLYKNLGIPAESLLA
jgi:HTH-type transcriptional regulator/antitoxin HigA